MPKARDYRRLHEIPDDLGTAVILQRMVFGNAGGSRAPVSRSRAIRRSVTTTCTWTSCSTRRARTSSPGARRSTAAERARVARPRRARGGIERSARCSRPSSHDAQEFELTVQDGELFLLQTRTAKRTPWAALRIATDQVQEGLITPQTALAAARRRSTSRRSGACASTTGGGAEPVARGTAASVGVWRPARSRSTIEAASAWRRMARHPCSSAPTRSTDDVASVAIAAGVLTGAAVARRTPPSSRATRQALPRRLHELEIDLDARRAKSASAFAEGDVICLDAESGLVFAGAPGVEERPSAELAAVASWARDAQPPGQRSPQATSQEHGH